MPRPKADLSSITVSKDSGDTVSPPVSGEASGAKGYAHTLSLRLTAEQYRRLRRFVAVQEDKTGKRTTHQAVFEAAFEEYVTKGGG